jgi:exopolyphosphatase/guanosine-5'-triphosphate,3'-diphosphate pyrophosphatase
VGLPLTYSPARWTRRRRKKRRSGKGPKGGNPVNGANGTAGAPSSGPPSGDPAANGNVDNQSQAQAASAASEGVSGSSPNNPQTQPTAAKRARKRKRGKAHTAGAAVASRQDAGAGSDQLASDALTSAKSKKAARRRGRRRRKAANGTVNFAPDLAAGLVQEIAIGKAAPEGAPETRSANSTPSGADAPGEAANGAGAAVPLTQPRPGKAVRVPSTRPRHTNGRAAAPLYAALDLGTNNCRLLIARPEERGFRVVDAFSRIVRLGEGVGAHLRLSDAAMDRAIDALAQCHRKLADRGVARSRLIATEACRAAENGAEFIDRVRSETGLALEVVNRETEARLAVAGCATLVDHDADGVILFDIGGGSSEIVWLDLRNRCGARGYALTRFIRSWISLPVGVVNLAERHGGVHVTPDIFEAMVEDAADHLSAFSLADNLSEAIASGRVHMLGTSGTVTTLAGVHLGLKRYDRRRVDGTWLDDRDVSHMIDQLRDMPYEARVENPCIGADRADLVLAGCAILEAIRRRWTCSRLRVADRGLREGILTELMSADGVWSQRRNGQRSHRGRQRNGS